MAAPGSPARLPPFASATMFPGSRISRTSVARLLPQSAIRNPRLSRGRAVALAWRCCRPFDIDDPDNLRKPVDDLLGKQEGHVEHGKPDREYDQDHVQVCGGAIEAAQPLLAEGRITR